MSRPAAFLDRDGVINVEVDYLHDPDKAVILPGVPAAIRELRRRGFGVVVITNQGGVGKGLYGEAEIAAVHARIDELLAADGVKVDGYYYCIHHPDFDAPCVCRKPSPYLLQRAAREHDLDLARSFMVGDRLSDIEAGQNAGCAMSILVRTGYGENLAVEAEQAGIPVANDLQAAVALFFQRFPG